MEPAEAHLSIHTMRGIQNVVTSDGITHTFEIPVQPLEPRSPMSLTDEERQDN